MNRILLPHGFYPPKKFTLQNINKNKMKYPIKLYIRAGCYMNGQQKKGIPFTDGFCRFIDGKGNLD